MRFQFLSRFTPLLVLVAALLIAGCSAPAVEIQPTASGQPTESGQPTASGQPAVLTQPAVKPTAASTTASIPIETIEKSQIEDPDEFKTALLEAMMDQDTKTLQSWMTFPFLTGGWRADASDSGPEDALQILYTHYLGTENHLELVKDADIRGLLGDRDPLSMPRPEAGVIEAVLVSGWGKDGRDEAILFIARSADNTLKWHGWIVINGGFSGARLGGNQIYTNEAYGYRVYLPKDVEVQATSPNHVLVMAPGVGHPGEQRAAAFIDVEPANGRTVEEIVEQVKADLGPGFTISPGTAMGLDKATAIVLSGLPGQDANRQLFVVYNDQLVHITFVPDAPQVGAPYEQMEDLYAMIVNTFHFTD